MSIAFLGDISLPPGVAPQLDDGFPAFRCRSIANLEGPILDLARSSRGVWNSPSVLDFLALCNVRAVSLANNHITDLEADPRETQDRLARVGIASFGAGSTAEAASAPLMLEDDDCRVALMGFGWSVIGCRGPDGSTCAGVSLLDPDTILRRIDRTRREQPDAKIVAFMHWNYEGEIYPQPAHRQLGFQMVDAGADAIVGCHPHCVQGVEVRTGVPIAYSLGNWFLPWGSFWGGELKYPEFMRRQLALEWSPRTGSTTCHWYDYDPATHALRSEGSEPTTTSDSIRQLTPFSGMTEREYRDWFREKRRKRLLLPVYDDIDARFSNRLKDKFVAGRQLMIDVALRTGLKGGPR